MSVSKICRYLILGFLCNVSHIIPWCMLCHLTSDNVWDCQLAELRADEPILEQPDEQSKSSKKTPANKSNKPGQQNSTTTATKAEKKVTLQDLKPEGVVNQELLQQVTSKLDLIDHNLAKYDGVPFQAVDRKGSLQLDVESPGVQVYHYGNNQSTRIFGFYLIIANLEDQPAEFPLSQLKLIESGKEISLTEMPVAIKEYSITLGERGESLKRFDHNLIMQIPPQGVAKSLVVFHGLDQGNHIPKLILTYQQKGQQKEIDINRRELGRLNLAKQRIGPEGSLMLLTIAGQTNMINSGSLIDELDAASALGVTRTVIEWNQDAKKFDSQCQNWFKQALEQHYSPNHWFNDQYPSFPSTIKELHFAFTSTDSFFTNYLQSGFSDRAKIYVHKNSIAACSSALRTAVEILPHDELVNLLEAKEPAAQVSVLAFAANKLTEDDLDLLLPLLESPDLVIKTSALSAISHIDHPDALSALLTAVRDNNKELATIAILSLTNSKIYLYQDELLKLYEHSELSIQQNIVRQVALSPHPKWLPILIEQYKHGSLELRVEAIKAIGQIKPDNLQELLLEALEDPEQKIWDTALGLMIKTPGKQNDEIMLKKIYQQLESGVTTANMLNYISQTRDPNAQELLFNYWKTGPGKSNSRVLTELLQMDDSAKLKEITNQYDTLNETEKSNYLRNFPLDHGDYQAYLSKWKAALLSDNNTLNNAAQEVYRKNPEEQMLDVIVQALQQEQGDKPNSNRVSKYCNMISQYGTIEARQSLRKFRGAVTNEQCINYAENALRNMYQNSPCYYFLYNARNQNENGVYSTAIKQLDIAIKVDPDIPDFYLERARSRVGMDNFDKAIEDYRKVIEIDPKHRTVWSLLADAYIEQREFDKAVETLNQAIDLYPKDVNLWNSRGHAYAMMENFEVSLTNYLKALELDGKNSLAITGVALAETYLGRFESGVERIRKARPTNRNDNLFAYNSACVYSRALEQLLKIESPSPAQLQLIKEYRQDGFKELKNSITLGFVNDEWIKKDPDLVPLSQDDNPEFKELLKLAAEKKAELIKKKKSVQAEE